MGSDLASGDECKLTDFSSYVERSTDPPSSAHMYGVSLYFLSKVQYYRAIYNVHDYSRT